MFYSLIGLLILILDIYVILMVLSNTAPLLNKLIWILVVLLLPVVRPLLYLIVGGK